MIPKRFIRIWLGEKKIPDLFEKWWDEFKILHPDYEFVTLTDDEHPPIPEHLNKIYSLVNSYAGRSDILRLVALYEIGGIYIDTDVMPLKTFDKLIQSEKPFIAQRSKKSFEIAVIGSPKKHQAVQDLLHELPKWFYEHLENSASVQTGPAFVSSVWFGRKDILHLPTTTFYPYNGFMAPKKDKKLETFANKDKFPPDMIAAHFSNHIWGGKPKDMKKHKEETMEKSISEDKKLNIFYLNKLKIKPFKDNPRLHSKEQIQQIANSIKEFGFRIPISVDENNTILAGHGRYRAAEMLGYEEMPCIQQKDLTHLQKKAFIIADNKITLNSTWDNDLLWEQVKELNGLGFNLDILGFDNAEMLPMLDDNAVTDFASEWENMPEFVQEDATAYRTIRVHFETDRDLELFSNLIGQKLTDKTKSIWYPKQEKNDTESKRYN